MLNYVSSVRIITPQGSYLLKSNKSKEGLKTHIRKTMYEGKGVWIKTKEIDTFIPDNVLKMSVFTFNN